MSEKRVKRGLTEFGLAAKKRMLELGINHSDLAEQVGTSRQYLCYIFTGVRSGAKYIDRIVDILGLDHKYIEKGA